VVKQAKRKDVTALVNACDAGREGELIFRLIEQYAGGAKPLGKPVKRLWLQSMTPQAIRDGFDSLRSEKQMQGLADAARSRSEADWLVGINGTRAMTAFNSRDGGFFLTTVGRVQTPTLAVVVEREEQIRKFISRDYWEIHASFLAEAGEYPAKWFDPKWKKGCGRRRKEGRPRLDPARSPGHCRRRARQGRHRHRGKQAHHAGFALPVRPDQPAARSQRRFGFSAKTTLALAQSLYERHKALTYPRTDSRAPARRLPARGAQTFEMLADSGMKHLAPFALTGAEGSYIKPTKRVFDNAKVSDHFAIIPTLQAPSGLSEAEQKLYDLVVRRFMAVFFPSAEYMVTTRISQELWATASRPKARCWSSRAGWPSTARKPPKKWPTPKKATRARTWCRCKPGEMVRAEVGRPQGPEDPPPRATPKPRCWAPWKAPASLWKTTNCAKPCRKKAWARQPPAPPSSKA
jgi:DNA topoisomerase-3